MPDPTPERPLASEVLANCVGSYTRSWTPPTDVLVAALLACFPDARYGVTLRPDGTVEEAEPRLTEEDEAIVLDALCDYIVQEAEAADDYREQSRDSDALILDARVAAASDLYERVKRSRSIARPLPAAPEGER